jgi:hypothetical protein
MVTPNRAALPQLGPGPADLLIFGAVVYFVVLQGLAQRGSSFQWFSLRFADEAVALALLPFVLQRMAVSKALIFCAAFFSIFLFVGVSGGLIAAHPGEGIAAQVASAIKTLVFLLAPTLLLRTINPRKLIDVLFWLILSTTVAFEAVRHSLPEVYAPTHDLLRQVGTLRLFDLGFPRAYGPFFHPSQLAVVSIALSAYYYIDRQPLKYAALLLLLAATGQIMDALTFASLLIFVALFRDPRKIALVWAALVILAVYGAVVFQAVSGLSAVELVVEPFRHDQQARVALLTTAGRLATEHFPLGAGFGGYGGAGAALYNPAAYVALGFLQYWWFNTGMFMMDSGLAQILGETGVLGLIALLFAFAALASFVSSRTNDASRAKAIAALALYPAVQTVASPMIYETAPLLVLGLVIWGILTQPHTTDV